MDDPLEHRKTLQVSSTNKLVDRKSSGCSDDANTSYKKYFEELSDMNSKVDDETTGPKEEVLEKSGHSI